MDVGVPEARRHRPAAELDDPAARPDPPADRRVRADRHDPPVADRERRRDRAGGVHGRDAAAAQDEIGRSVRGHAARMTARSRAVAAIPSVATLGRERRPGSMPR